MLAGSFHTNSINSKKGIEMYKESLAALIEIKRAIPGLFSVILVFSMQVIVNVQYKMLLMTGFKLRASGIGSDRSTNCPNEIKFISSLFFLNRHHRDSFCSQIVCLSEVYPSVFFSTYYVIESYHLGVITTLNNATLKVILTTVMPLSCSYYT